MATNQCLLCKIKLFFEKADHQATLKEGLVESTVGHSDIVDEDVGGLSRVAFRRGVS